MSSWDQANRREKLGLLWRNKKKISQIINDYPDLPFFFLIILFFLLHFLDLGLGEDVEEEPHVQALEVDGVDDGREWARLLSVPGPEDFRLF
jgi:hypothetical protein